MKSRPDELEVFKTAINLTELMGSFGYGIDRTASSRNSAVMAHPDGDKLVVNDRAIVIAEMGVDALSYAALYGSEGTHNLSTAGWLNETQPGLIRAAIKELGQGRVIAAVDHDAGGDESSPRSLKRSVRGSGAPQIVLEQARTPSPH